MSASADCSCRARKGLRALPPASVVMCKVTEAACRGVGGRRADGGRKQGGQSAAFYRRGARPPGRGRGRPGPAGAGGRGGGVLGGWGGGGVGGRRRCPSKGRRGQERDGYG